MSSFAENIAIVEEIGRRSHLEEPKVEFPSDFRLGSHDKALRRAAEFIQESVDPFASKDIRQSIRTALAIITVVRGEIQKLERINPYYLDILDASLDELIADELIAEGIQSEMEL